MSPCSGRVGRPAQSSHTRENEVSQPRMTRIFTDKRGWIQGFLTSVGILRRWQPFYRRFTGSSSVQVIHADMPALRGVGNAAGKVIARRVTRAEFSGMRPLSGGRDQGWDGIRMGIEAVCRFRPKFPAGAPETARGGACGSRGQDAGVVAHTRVDCGLPGARWQIPRVNRELPGSDVETARALAMLWKYPGLDSNQGPKD